MSSPLFSSKQLTSFLLLCMILCSSLVSFSQADKQPQTDELERVKSKIEKKFDSSQTIGSILRKFGLSNFEHSFLRVFDQADNLFRNLNHDQHFQVINRILDAFKIAWLHAMDQYQQSSDTPSGSIDADAMNDFVKVVEEQFHRILSNDKEVRESELAPFLAQVHHVFDMVTSAYEQILELELPIQLSWSLFFMVKPLIERIPTDLFERAMFQELLEMPSLLKERLHDLLENLLSGDQAHFIRLILTFLSNLDYSMLQDKFNEL